MFWINYLSTYGLPSIFLIFVVPTLFLPTKSCLISKKNCEKLGHDLHLEEAEVPTDSELKEEAYDSDDSDI